MAHFAGGEETKPLTYRPALMYWNPLYTTITIQFVSHLEVFRVKEILKEFKWRKLSPSNEGHNLPWNSLLQVLLKWLEATVLLQWWCQQWILSLFLKIPCWWQIHWGEVKGLYLLYNWNRLVKKATYAIADEWSGSNYSLSSYKCPLETVQNKRKKHWGQFICQANAHWGICSAF